MIDTTFIFAGLALIGIVTICNGIKCFINKHIFKDDSDDSDKIGSWDNDIWI